MWKRSASHARCTLPQLLLPAALDQLRLAGSLAAATAAYLWRGSARHWQSSAIRRAVTLAEVRGRRRKWCLPVGPRNRPVLALLVLQRARPAEQGALRAVIAGGIVFERAVWRWTNAGTLLLILHHPAQQAGQATALAAVGLGIELIRAAENSCRPSAQLLVHDDVLFVEAVERMQPDPAAVDAAVLQPAILLRQPQSNIRALALERFATGRR